MFINKAPMEKSLLDEAIDDIFREMSVMNADSKEYARMVKQLEKLYKLREGKKTENMSKDTMAIVIGNLLGIGMIVGYERMNVVTSKALNLLIKLR